MSTKIRICSTICWLNILIPPKKLCQTFFPQQTTFLNESTKGRLSLKQDKNMKVRFHGEKREYVGDTFSRGSTCWNTTRRLLCHLEGGVRWITGNTVPLHFRNPITVLGGVREGGCQCRTMQGRERRREGPVTLLSSNAPPPPTASCLCRTSAQNISFSDDRILHQGVMEFKEFDLDIV